MHTEITISVSPKAATEKESIKFSAARKLNIDVNSISDIKIHKRSIDARSRKINIHLKVMIFTDGEIAVPKNYQKAYKYVASATPIIIVGSGPVSYTHLTLPTILLV